LYQGGSIQGENRKIPSFDIRRRVVSIEKNFKFWNRLESS